MTAAEYGINDLFALRLYFLLLFTGSENQKTAHDEQADQFYMR
jgi:hypothetical protein